MIGSFCSLEYSWSSLHLFAYDLILPTHVGTSEALRTQPAANATAGISTTLRARRWRGGSCASNNAQCLMLDMPWTVECHLWISLAHANAKRQWPSCIVDPGTEASATICGAGSGYDRPARYEQERAIQIHPGPSRIQQFVVPTRTSQQLQSITASTKGS